MQKSLHKSEQDKYLDVHILDILMLEDLLQAGQPYTVFSDHPSFF